MSALDENLAFALRNNKVLLNDLMTNRHPSTAHMVKVLAPNPNLVGELYDIASDLFGLAIDQVQAIHDSPELTAGLRKLLEAKDCFIRAYLDRDPVDYRDR